MPDAVLHLLDDGGVPDAHRLDVAHLESRVDLATLLRTEVELSLDEQTAVVLRRFEADAYGLHRVVEPQDRDGSLAVVEGALERPRFDDVAALVDVVEHRCVPLEYARLIVESFQLEGDFHVFRLAHGFSLLPSPRDSHRTSRHSGS
jgi:hypothetical protein